MQRIFWRRLSALLLVSSFMSLFTFSYAAELPDFTTLVKQNTPSVVNIAATKTVKSSHLGPNDQVPPEMEEFLEKFFGSPMMPYGQPGHPGKPGQPQGPGAPENTYESAGSGFVIDTDGYILTNNHVVKDADEIIVRLNDSRELTAKLIGADKGSDLALLKIDAKNLVPVKFGSSETLQVGEWVLAIGSPFGFDHTVTAGIVSAKGRGLESEFYVPFIQTDVAINPGNSGGPLFNLKGEVVGINSQIVSRSGGYLGLSFAIPSDTAVEVVQQLKANGHVRRGWLGVVFQRVDRQLAQSFGLGTTKGGLVSQVVPGGPADKAGVKSGDVIVTYNNSPVENVQSLPPLVGRTKPGDKIQLGVIRDHKPVNITVTIAELDTDKKAADAAKNGQKAKDAKNRIGVSVRNLTDAERKKLELGPVGIRVEQVAPGMAAKAGVRPNDIILSIAQHPISEAKDFEQLVAKLQKGQIIPLLVLRGDSQRYLAMKVE
jgi:serine protease Do